ncbi:MAG: hypothetical protein ACJAR2_003746 [Ilumatobacter sp.]|jgi:hypothetical protein
MIEKNAFGRTTRPGTNSSDTRFTVASSFLSLAICTQPDAFEPKERWAMDWYYPALTGALTGDQAKARMASSTLAKFCSRSTSTRATPQLQ